MLLIRKRKTVKKNNNNNYTENTKVDEPPPNKIFGPFFFFFVRRFEKRNVFSDLSFTRKTPFRRHAHIVNRRHKLKNPAKLMFGLRFASMYTNNNLCYVNLCHGRLINRSHRCPVVLVIQWIHLLRNSILYSVLNVYTMYND